MLGADLFHGVLDLTEYLLNTRKQLAALSRQAQASGLALEQRIAQVLFQPGDLPDSGMTTGHG